MLAETEPDHKITKHVNNICCVHGLDININKITIIYDKEENPNVNCKT